MRPVIDSAADDFAINTVHTALASGELCMHSPCFLTPRNVSFSMKQVGGGKGTPHQDFVELGTIGSSRHSPMPPSCAEASLHIHGTLECGRRM